MVDVRGLADRYRGAGALGAGDVTGRTAGGATRIATEAVGADPILAVGVAITRAGRDVENDLEENAPDSMHGVMPVEPFPHKPVERSRHDSRVAHGDLIFNDDVSGGVGLSTFTDRQVPTTVIGDHKIDARVLVELEPFVGVRRLVGVVPHVQSFLLIAARRRCPPLRASVERLVSATTLELLARSARARVVAPDLFGRAAVGTSYSGPACC